MQCGYSSPPLPTGHVFQDSQWMPEPADGTKPNRDYAFSYTYIPMSKFNLQIRDSRRLTTTTKIEQYNNILE